jgi:hypothetical protein
MVGGQPGQIFYKTPSQPIAGHSDMRGQQEKKSLLDPMSTGKKAGCSDMCLSIPLTARSVK